MPLRVPHITKVRHTQEKSYAGRDIGRRLHKYQHWHQLGARICRCSKDSHVEISLVWNRLLCEASAVDRQ
eukprot:6080625-Prymnesium_polylepis.1